MTYRNTNCILEHDQPCTTLDQTLTCRWHHDRMLRHLRQLGPLDRALAARAATLASSHTGSRSAESRIPLDVNAAALRRHIRQKLAGWVLAVAAHRDIGVPDIANAPTTTSPRHQWIRGRMHTVTSARTDVDLICGWLERHLHWAASQHTIGPDQWTVDDLATDLEQLQSAAFAVAYPTRRSRIFIAPCTEPGCRGNLIVTVRPASDDPLPDAVCTADDEHTVTPRYWLDLADHDRQLTAVQLSALWDVPLKTVERWARDDEWPHDDGRPRRYLARVASTTHDMRRTDPLVLAGQTNEPYCASQ